MIFCFLRLAILWGLVIREDHTTPPTIATGGDIGVSKIMELEQDLIEDGDSFDSGDSENCDTGTMYYDLVPSQIVLSDHPISAFQQGHQAFPFVKLKDNSTCSLNNNYPSFLPMVPVILDHTFAQYPDLHLHMTLIDHFHATLPNSKPSAINIGRYYSIRNLPMSTALQVEI